VVDGLAAVVDEQVAVAAGHGAGLARWAACCVLPSADSQVVPARCSELLLVGLGRLATGAAANSSGT
jgi:hypothetical protein